MVSRERSWKFDYLKGMSCILIIFLHCRLYGRIGDAYLYCVRFPVPLFFMISGYFLYKKSNSWIIKKVKKLIILLIGTELFYFLSETVMKVAFDKLSIAEALYKTADFSHFGRKIFCGTFFNETLWYLYAIIWTMIIVLCLRKAHIYSFKVLLGIVLIFINVQVIGCYLISKYGDVQNYIFLFRNALTFGLPLTALGMLIAEKEDIIIGVSTEKNITLLLILGGA